MLYLATRQALGQLFETVGKRATMNTLPLGPWDRLAVELPQDHHRCYGLSYLFQWVPTPSRRLRSGLGAVVLVRATLWTGAKVTVRTALPEKLTNETILWVFDPEVLIGI
jgi:hypothetical protein